MYDIFGEFNSFEEINKAAIGQLKEGDTKNIHLLAKENGIDEDTVEAYIDGDIPFLTDSLSAAFGKLDIELKDMKDDALASEIVEILKNNILRDKEMQKAIRIKGKSLKAFVASLWKQARQRAQAVQGGKGCSIMPAEEYRLAKSYYMNSSDKNI